MTNQTLTRERIAAEVYTQQQQTYRELELLYHEATKRLMVVQDERDAYRAQLINAQAEAEQLAAELDYAIRRLAVIRDTSEDAIRAAVEAQRERCAQAVKAEANSLVADVSTDYYNGYKDAIARTIAAIRSEDI
jgi:hypothetical protein